MIKLLRDQVRRIKPEDLTADYLLEMSQYHITGFISPFLNIIIEKIDLKLPKRRKKMSKSKLKDFDELMCSSKIQRLFPGIEIGKWNLTYTFTWKGFEILVNLASSGQYNRTTLDFRNSKAKEFYYSASGFERADPVKIGKLIISLLSSAEVIEQISEKFVLEAQRCKKAILVQRPLLEEILKDFPLPIVIVEVLNDFIVSCDELKLRFNVPILSSKEEMEEIVQGAKNDFKLLSKIRFLTSNNLDFHRVREEFGSKYGKKRA